MRLTFSALGSKLRIAFLFLCCAAPCAAQQPYTASGVVVRSTNAGAALDLPATLLKPQGNGPFPAIVMMHDCSGLGSRSSGSPGRWGSLLAGEGYVVIIADSFLPRGFPDGVCIVKPASRGLAAAPAVRVADAFAALAFLRGLPYVEGKHVAIMGGSHGGSSTLATLATPAEDGFAGGIALYPGCAANYGGWGVTRARQYVGPVTAFNGIYKPAAPLLILVGEKDDWTPAGDCRVLAERAQAAGQPVSLKIYPGAYHSFDSDRPSRYLDERNNANKPEGHGATTGGDPVAWADAIKEVKAFLAAHLRAK